MRKSEMCTCVCFLSTDVENPARTKKIKKLVENMQKLSDIPENCFAYYFFNSLVSIVEGKEVFKEEVCCSGKYFIKGIICNRENISENTDIFSLAGELMKDEDNKIIQINDHHFELFKKETDFLLIEV